MRRRSGGAVDLLDQAIDLAPINTHVARLPASRPRRVEQSGELLGKFSRLSSDARASHGVRIGTQRPNCEPDGARCRIARNAVALGAGEPDATDAHVAHVRNDMRLIQIAHVDVLNDLTDYWQRPTSKKDRCSEKRLGIRSVDGRDSHTELKRRRSVNKPHPEAAQMSAQVSHHYECCNARRPGASWVESGSMTVRDLSMLPDDVRDAARVRENGEVEWPLADTPSAIDALAGAGRIVLGLDLRSYPDGNTREISWSAFEPNSDGVADIEEARQAAHAALARDNFAEYRPLAEWVLITWQ